MKNLGKIEIGGSLDITTNQHVEDLIEEALEGIDIPEGAGTTYTLTQDGLTVQLVDGDGQVVSEIEIPKFEDEDTTYTLTQDGSVVQLVDGDGNAVSEFTLPEAKDPYQEEKDFINFIRSAPVNLYDTIRSGGYDDFDITSEFNEETNRISIYLHLDINGDVKTFTIADNEYNDFPYFSRGGRYPSYMNLVEVYKDGTSVLMIGDYGGSNFSNRRLWNASISTTNDVPIDSPDYFSEFLTIHDDNFFFVFDSVNDRTESDPELISGTLEDHIQGIYDALHHLYN